jgi:predicted HAD superfamily Cof-like phosphohydrolase
LTNFDKVGKFMETMEQDVFIAPCMPDDETVSLRIALIREELNELISACVDRDLVEIADGLADILYVTYGAGHAFGIDLDSCFDEVQRSNMTKIGKDGKVIYSAEGKVLKPDNYSPPNLAKVLEAQCRRAGIVKC